MKNTVLIVSVVSQLAMLAGCSSTKPVHSITDQSCVTIYHDCDPVLRYRYDGVAYKPYVDALWTPGVVNIVRNRPSDHIHHHGMMFALSVDGVNYWEEGHGEDSEPGRQIHTGPICTQGNTIKDRIEWTDPEDKVALLEDRTIEYIQLDNVRTPVTIINWHGDFELPEGKESAEIGGAFYFGLGTRFVEEIDATATFFNSEGAKNNDETYMKPANWCAMHASINDVPVTYAMFKPQKINNRPVTWFTMTDQFAYMSATWRLHEEPMTLKKGEPFNWFYGVAVWQEHIAADEIECTYQQWLKTLD